MLSTLSQPFPQDNSLVHKWKIILLFGAFISFFMVVFQPFGLRNVPDSYRIYVLSGYGLVTMVVLMFNLFIIQPLFSKVFDERSWVVYKEVLWILWIVLTIGLGNIIYTRVLFSFPELSVKGMLLFELYTMAIAIIPVTAYILITQNRLLKENLAMANTINTRVPQEKNELENKDADNNQVSIYAENNKDKISFALKDLRFIESFGNYVKVHYLNEEKPRAEILRKTMKQLEKELKEYSDIFRCHRAYLVNTTTIVNVSGNAQGYRLKLQGISNEVPVSRSFIPQFNTMMKN